MDTIIYFNSLHHIDLNNDSILPADFQAKANDLNNYIVKLLDIITKIKNNRRFIFSSDTTEVRSALNVILNNKEFTKSPQIIANRLFRVEKQAQEKYDKITTIHKGSLIQSYLNYDDSDMYIITKVDHHSFLDEKDLQTHIGLPFEKHVLKVAIIEFTDDKDVLKTYVYDTNIKISEYWWKDFLELEEINTDEQNTQVSFKSIDSLLSKRVKQKSPSDYTFLRNNLVGYFRTHREFSFDDLLENVFGTYQPTDPKLQIEIIKEEVSKLPEKKNFDRRFTVIEDQIKARFKRVIPLHEKIDLNLKANIENLREIIKAYEDPTGEKYIQIKTEEGYKVFK